jgi:hypothetical protein
VELNILWKTFGQGCKLPTHLRLDSATCRGEEPFYVIQSLLAVLPIRTTKSIKECACAQWYNVALLPWTNNRHHR